MTILLLKQFEGFILVFMRNLAIIIMVPFFGSKTVPSKMKIAFALLLSVIIFPLVKGGISVPSSISHFLLGLTVEMLIGAAIGFIVRLMFSGIEMAGQLAGMQMGFAMANVLDPQSNSQLSVLAQFYNLLAILLFFTLNLHLVFISAIRDSYRYIPLFGGISSITISKEMMQLGGVVFAISIKLSAPIMVAILLANVAMGVLARTVPQMNIFVVGFPVTIALGLIVMALSLPFILSSMGGVFSDTTYGLANIIATGVQR